MLQNAVTLLQASYSKTLNDRVELRVSAFVCLLVWFISRQQMANLGYCHNLFIVAQRAIQRRGVKEGWCALCCQSAI